MISGSGIDIVELQRIEAVMKRQPRFIERILTEGEKQTFLLLKNKRQIEFMAGRFAAKEAFVKAAETEVISTFGWQDIEIRKKTSGKPYLVVKGYNNKMHLSISHSGLYAVASVIIESLPG